MSENDNVESNNEKVTKRVPLNKETYKFIKKMVIEEDLDNDGTIKPEMIGVCIDKLVTNMKANQNE